MSKVFEIWPNAADLARAIGVNPITVRTWRRRGSIPAEIDLVLIEAARSRGSDLTLEDLARERDARRRAAEAKGAA